MERDAVMDNGKNNAIRLIIKTKIFLLYLLLFGFVGGCNGKFVINAMS